jgi:CRISPR/Cas system-associated exonuclease Cas4 (RecB family)
MARRQTQTTEPSSRLGEIKHLSYSTLDNWFQCPKKVELSKIRKAPARPAWWFAGGSAVHEATEEYDRWTLRDPVNRKRFSIAETFALSFDQEVKDMEARWPETSEWRHAGPKTAPETYDRWMKLGPLLVGNYITWRRSQDYVIWTASRKDADMEHREEVVGIEIDLSTTLPGCDREIKAYADRLFWSPSLQQIHVIDLKTGTRGPSTALQFGVYGACLEHLYGVKAATGAAFMNRQGALGKAFPLAKYTPEYVGRLFANLSRAVDNNVFPAHKGSSCRMCDVEAACYANDGPQAHLYDPDSPDCPPF